MKKEQGITLIALVITIIVLLILAGVTISLVVGDNGILSQATRAIEENKKAEEGEKVKLAAVAAIDTKDLRVKEGLLRAQLENAFGSNENNDKFELTPKTDGYEVTIKESGRMYKIDSFGNVVLMNSNGDTTEDIPSDIPGDTSGDTTNDTTGDTTGDEDDIPEIKGPKSITIQGNTNIKVDVFESYWNQEPQEFYAYDENGNLIDGSNISWTSSNTNVLTVNENKNYSVNPALIRVYDSGKVTLRATSKTNPSIYGELEITVIGPSKSLSIKPIGDIPYMFFEANTYLGAYEGYIFEMDVYGYNSEYATYGIENQPIKFKLYDKDGNAFGKTQVEWTNLSDWPANLSVGDDGEVELFFEIPCDILLKASLTDNPNEYTIVVLRVAQG